MDYTFDANLPQNYENINTGIDDGISDEELEEFDFTDAPTAPSEEAHGNS